MLTEQMKAEGWVENDFSVRRREGHGDVMYRDGDVRMNRLFDTIDFADDGVDGDVIAYRDRSQQLPAAAAPDGHQALTFHAEQQPGLAINPKDAIGATKIPLHLFPAEAIAMGSLGMLEGMLKYGKNNFIAADGVIASIYVDACMRHLQAWFEGEEGAHDTKTPHLGNAIACLAILIKARAHGKLIDDRNYGALPNGARYRALIEELTPHVKRLKEMFADKSPRHFTIADVAADAGGREAA